MEHWFGPYPFYEDGYKLVDAPYLGMEHQSAVAYGNRYRKYDWVHSRPFGGRHLKWDYIIVHESGHEWFGNNITTRDFADLWVHEGFTTYSEALFIESYFGKTTGQKYVYSSRSRIRNKKPLIGPYGVNRRGPGDVYSKGSALLNMLRTLVDDDEKWRQLLRGLSSAFYHQTVTSQEIIDYFNQHSGKDLTKVFEQYLRNAAIPTLEVRFENQQAQARWVADVPGFDMPIRMRLKGGEYQFVPLTTQFQAVAQLPGATKQNLEIDTSNYYVAVRLQ